MSYIQKPATAGTLPPTVVETITGNDLVKEAAVDHNFNIFTANATPWFRGSSGQETLDFGIPNLILGSFPPITTAQTNTGMGEGVLLSLTSGQGNNAYGSGCLDTLTNALNNNALGSGAGTSIESGSDNTMMGNNSLASNVGGNQSVAIGGNSTANYTLGGSTAVGFNSLNANVTGIESCAFGWSTLKVATSGGNTAGGYGSMEFTTSGGQNTGWGRGAFANLLTGSSNLGLGYNVGTQYVGAESNNILLSHLGVVGDNNTTRIGTQGTQTTAFMAGITGNTVANSELVTINSSTGQLGAIPTTSLFTPNSTLSLSDDFMVTNNIQAGGLVGQLGWNLSGSGVWTPLDGASTPSHPGTVGHTSMAATGVRWMNLVLTAATVNAGGMLIGGGVITFNWVFNIVNLSSANRYTLTFGLGDTITATFANGIWFSYSDNVNSGNWVINSSTATTATNTNSSVPVTTGWHNAQCVINAAGTSAQFFMDGASLGTVSTTMPVTGMAPSFGLTWGLGTVAASSVIVDLFYLIQNLTTSR
jgi:hypothetical protein